eukprot:1020744-Pelagomonas_calceolata.AAC.2
MGLLARKTVLENKYQSRKGKDTFSWTLPPYIHNALQKWAHANQEEEASSMDYNTQYLHYWSSNPHVILYGAQRREK